ncbi:MAG: hypothetical protein KC636_31940, partial [Myxococcales bacterium]|nr:hypothetical protein [Myxococcales bacterium]
PRPKAPDFTPKPPDDDALRPSFDATSAIKEFEDTPLPRQLPDANTHDQLPTLLTEDEEMFAGVALGDDEGDTGDDLAADIEEPERSSPGQLLGRISDLMVDDDDEPEEATRAEINPIELDAEPTRAAATFINDLVEIGAGDDDIIELIDDDEMVELAADEEDEALEDDDATRTADADAVAEEALEPEPEPDEALDESLEELSSIEQLDEPSDELAAVSLETIGDVAGLTYEDLAAEAAAARIEGEAAALDPDDELPDLDDIDADLLDLDVDDDLLADLDAPLDTLAGDGELDAPEREPDAPVRREELVDFAELDDIDIDLDVLGGQAQGGPPSVVEEPTQRDYEEGQMLFNEGVSAMHEGDYAAALSRFEEAYDHGLDDAELRAMIAFARYRHNGGDETTAAESLEQLEYAEQMNPDLDLIYAYRGAIYLGLGIEDSARESFKYALQLNPDCELANDFINNM